MDLGAIVLESNPAFPTYPNRTANGKEIIFVSHLSILCFALVSSVLSIGLYYSSIDLGYLYSIMGILISSAVLPAVLTLFWKKQSQLAVCLSPLIDSFVVINNEIYFR